MFDALNPSIALTAFLTALPSSRMLVPVMQIRPVWVGMDPGFVPVDVGMADADGEVEVPVVVVPVVVAVPVLVDGFGMLVDMRVPVPEKQEERRRQDEGGDRLVRGKRLPQPEE